MATEWEQLQDVLASDHKPILPGSIVAPKKAKHEYTDDLADVITDYYISGLSISRICEHVGMPPPGVVYRWMKEFPGFREKMNEARQIRAHAFEDKALMAAESATSKENIGPARLQFDAYAWAAEKNDPSRYGRQMKVDGIGDMKPVFNVYYAVPENKYLAEQSKKVSQTTPVQPLADDSNASHCDNSGVSDSVPLTPELTTSELLIEEP